jgi:hypothetical protein
MRNASRGTSKASCEAFGAAGRRKATSKATVRTGTDRCKATSNAFLAAPATATRRRAFKPSAGLLQVESKTRYYSTTHDEHVQTTDVLRMQQMSFHRYELVLLMNQKVYTTVGRKRCTYHM